MALFIKPGMHMPLAWTLRGSPPGLSAPASRLGLMEASLLWQEGLHRGPLVTDSTSSPAPLPGG